MFEEGLKVMGGLYSLCCQPNTQMKVDTQMKVNTQMKVDLRMPSENKDED